MGVLTNKRMAFIIGVACGGCCLVGCTNMTDTFSRIDSNKLRVIGVTLSPRPEVSPGDTVTATAYFGGNAVTSVGEFTLAHAMAAGTDGVAPKDSYPVSCLAPVRGLPDSAQFSFVVGRDVFIGRQGFDSVDQKLSDSVSRVLARPADSVAAFIAGLSDSQRTRFGSAVEKMVLPAGFLFTALSTNGSRLRVVFRFVINYRGQFPGMPARNNNPGLKWVGVCRVPDAEAMGFSPFDPAGKGKYSLTYLYNRNDPSACDSVIVVDTGYAYFLVADNGVSQAGDPAGIAADTAREYIVDADGSRRYEQYYYHWFYQNVDAASDDADSMMEIADGTSACVEMKPPENTGMKRFNVWVALSDEMPNRWTRPRGTCIRRLRGEFRFTDAYKAWSGQ
jgi:hypothetical protein